MIFLPQLDPPRPRTVWSIGLYINEQKSSNFCLIVGFEGPVETVVSTPVLAVDAIFAVVAICECPDEYLRDTTNG